MFFAINALLNTVFAQVNPSINFVGKVTETDGSELPDGVYDFNFELYSAATGGVALWSEELTATTCFSAIIASSTVGLNTTTYTYNSETATTTLRVGQYLSDSSGNSALISDFDIGAGTVTVVGANVWPNATAISNRPFVEGGVIDVDLGTVSNFAGVDFNQSLYLEITFNGEVMRPRKLID